MLIIRRVTRVRADLDGLAHGPLFVQCHHEHLALVISQPLRHRRDQTSLETSTRPSYVHSHEARVN